MAKLMPDQAPDAEIAATDVDDIDDALIDDETAPLSRRTLAAVLVGCSLVGLFCALALSIEKLELLANPGRGLTCDINQAVQCTDVMLSWQSNLFGFPNPLVGLMSFAITATVGMALFAGARFAEWFWGGLQVGVTLGAIFVHWLMFNTMFDIGAICPYCMAVWAITMPMFFLVTARNAYRYAATRSGGAAEVAGFVARMGVPLLLVWYVAAAAFVGSMIVLVL